MYLLILIFVFDLMSCKKNGRKYMYIFRDDIYCIFSSGLTAR